MDTTEPSTTTELAQPRQRFAASLREGWIDRLLGVPDRLPGPSLVWFLVLFAAIVLGASAPARLAGESTAEVELYVLLPAAIIVYFLAFAHLVRRVARSSFEGVKDCTRIGRAGA